MCPGLVDQKANEYLTATAREHRSRWLYLEGGVLRETLFLQLRGESQLLVQACFMSLFEVCMRDANVWTLMTVLLPSRPA